MRVLAIDIGTGTQDILLFDTDLHPENCFKMSMPSPTMMVAQKVKAATRQSQSILIDGVTMGGGPCSWALRDHVQAGNEAFITPHAARTIDDDLSKVQADGITVVSKDEAVKLQKSRSGVLSLSMHDFDYRMIAQAFESFGVTLELDGVAVAVFDHGAAPPDVSDRQFRFDYLNEQIQKHNSLSAFAFPADNIPLSMTRLEAITRSTKMTGMPDETPLMVMDTAPAAVLGALFDREISAEGSMIVANVGNFHTLAFRLNEKGIAGVFEHHTGLIDTEKLDGLITSLATSTLQHNEVFDDHGHGALIYDPEPMSIKSVAVTGPRRMMMTSSSHPVHFAVPFGDMMIAGCFGLVRAWADVMAGNPEPILDALSGSERGAPWELL